VLKKRKDSRIYFNKSKTGDFTNTEEVWDFPIVRVRGERHSAPFDLHFARECLFRWCPPGGLVCDPYSGWGTTMLASCRENRRFIGTEIDRNSAEKAKKRILGEMK
jgi:DNA modification methylase